MHGPSTAALPSLACRRRESTHGAGPARSSTPGMAARLGASLGVGPVLPRPAKIRPNLDHSRCALSCPSMSLLDLSKWHGARSFWET